MGGGGGAEGAVGDEEVGEGGAGVEGEGWDCVVEDSLGGGGRGGGHCGGGGED